MENSTTTEATLGTNGSEKNIDELLARINTLAAGGTVDPPASSSSVMTGGGPAISGSADQDSPDEFFPHEPNTLAESEVSESMMEELICKFLLAKGEASIRDISNQIGMPFQIVENCIVHLKQEQVLGYVDQAAMNDYICKLTEVGRERGRRYTDLCSYFGAAPVSFKAYVDSVNAQTINNQNPSEEDLARAFSDLLIDPEMMRKLGPAVNSGRGMFLFGYPGNGKTSIAERVTAAFGPYVWIPRDFDGSGHRSCF